MSKATTNFRQTDMTRALRAARNAGLKIASVHVDSKTGDFELRTKDDPEIECDGAKADAVTAAAGG